MFVNYLKWVYYICKKKKKKKKGSLDSLPCKHVFDYLWPTMHFCSQLRCGTVSVLSAFGNFLEHQKCLTPSVNWILKLEAARGGRKLQLRISPHTWLLPIQDAWWELQRSGDVSFTEDVPSEGHLWFSSTKPLRPKEGENNKRRRTVAQVWKGPHEALWGGFNLWRFLDGICIYHETKTLKCAIVAMSR